MQRTGPPSREPCGVISLALELRMSISPRLLAGIACVFFPVCLAACSSGGNSGAVVTVKGQAITHADLDQKLEDSPASRSVLQSLVTNVLIDKYAQEHNITVSDADIDKQENQYKAQYPAGAWDEMLKSRNMSEQEVRDIIRRQLVLDKAVGANVHVSEKQIADYFAKNHVQYDQPAMAHARHILVPDLKTANKVEADLKAGKDFAAEAKQYSVDPGSRDKGGDVGWFRKGQMVPPFEAYVFSAPLHKISQPVKSTFGYHIIEVLERKPAKLATLASAHDQIEQALKQQQESPLIPAFIQQLTANGNIVVNDPKFASLYPSPAPGGAGAPGAAPSAAATK